MQMVKTCARGILSEFKLHKFGFTHHQLEEFYKSQWQRSERSLQFLLYRWTSACFFIGVFIACVVLQLSDGKLFIFLTNWGIVLCMMTQLLAAILATRWHYNVNDVRTNIMQTSKIRRTTGTNVLVDDMSGTSKLIKFYWLLHGVTLSLALVITTVYWTFLHGKMNKPVRFPAMSFITHCMNTVFMLADFFIVAFPVRILHCVYAMLLPIIYYLFTGLYYYCGGTDEYGNHYVYPILDWKTPTRGLKTFAGVFVLYIIYSLILFALYKLKRLLSRTLNLVDSPHCVGLI